MEHDTATLDELRARLAAPVPDEILLLALTHPSFVGEGPERTLLSNQRLEFLGDAVLGAIVAELLYRADALLPEGDLTQRKAAAVRGRSLEAAARRLELGRYLRLGRGEEGSGGRGRGSILADAFEAIVGALFLSCGWNTTRDFVSRTLAEELAAVEQNAGNIKNRLQEHTQAIGLGTPRYQTAPAAASGLERRFSAQVLLLDEVRGRGTGRTKKEAECNAAQAAFNAMSNAGGDKS